MSLTIVDIFIAALCLVVGYWGSKRGFLGSVLSFVGAACGVSAIKYVVPKVQSHSQVHTQSQSYQPFLVSMGLIIFGYAVGMVAARILTGSVRGGIFGSLDRLVGAAIHVLLAVGTIWALAPDIAQLGSANLQKDISHSQILAWVDKHVPASVKRYPGLLKNSISSAGGAQTYEVNNTSHTRSLIDSSMAKVTVNIPSCHEEITGSAFFIRPHYLLTNAHVIAGADTVQLAYAGSTYHGTVVLVEPNKDVAIVYTPEIGGVPVHLASGPVSEQQRALAAGFPQGGDLEYTTENIDSVFSVSMPNIYNHGSYIREVYSLTGGLKPGNSGGPLILPNNSVVGMVFGVEKNNIGHAFSLSYAEIKDYFSKQYGRRGVSSIPTC